MVKAYRTRVIDWFVGLVNGGKILFPMGSPHEQEVIEHLLALKRVESRTAGGEEAVRWKSTSNDDHWFFACLYAAIAWDLSETVNGRQVVPVGPWMMGRVRMAVAA